MLARRRAKSLSILFSARDGRRPARSWPNLGFCISANGVSTRRCARPLERIRVPEDSRAGAMWPNGASECERSECPTSGPEGARSAGCGLGDSNSHAFARATDERCERPSARLDMLSRHRGCSGFVFFKVGYALIRRDLTLNPERMRGGIARVLAPVSLISAFSLSGRIHGLSQDHPS